MKKLLTLITVIGILLFSVSAQAHGGGTDKDGCHREKATNTKHCH